MVSAIPVPFGTFSLRARSRFGRRESPRWVGTIGEMTAVSDGGSAILLVLDLETLAGRVPVIVEPRVLKAAGDLCALNEQVIVHGASFNGSVVASAIESPV